MEFRASYRSRENCVNSRIQKGHFVIRWNGFDDQVEVTGLSDVKKESKRLQVDYDFDDGFFWFEE